MIEYVFLVVFFYLILIILFKKVYIFRKHIKELIPISIKERKLKSVNDIYIILYL
jgi:hypothetical protein